MSRGRRKGKSQEYALEDSEICGGAWLVSVRRSKPHSGFPSEVRAQRAQVRAWQAAFSSLR